MSKIKLEIGAPVRYSDKYDCEGYVTEIVGQTEKFWLVNVNPSGHCEAGIYRFRKSDLTMINHPPYCPAEISPVEETEVQTLRKKIKLIDWDEIPLSKIEQIISISGVSFPNQN